MRTDSLAMSKTTRHLPREEGSPGLVEEVALKGGRVNNSYPGSKAANSPSLPADLAQSWLAWQCRMVAGIIRGAIYRPSDAEQGISLLSDWPPEGEDETLLVDAASSALAKNRGLVLSLQRYGPGNRRTCDLIASPLFVGDEPVAVIAVMISTRSESQQHAVLQLLQWGGLWMETLVRQQLVAQQERGVFSVTLMTAVLRRCSAREAAMEVVSRLADHLECERVSLGLRQGLSIRLQALSHVASFDARSQLVRSIEAAMEESVDQSCTLVQPLSGTEGTSLTRAHTELVERQGCGAVCTVPLPGRSGFVGAITLERKTRQPFDKDTRDLCETLAPLIGPALEVKQREERALWTRGAEAMMESAAGLFGATGLKSKLLLLSAVAAVSALTFTDGRFQVTAPASIEGAVRQLLVAPQNGYVRQAEVRAGDLVEEGQLVATLDDRNLKLEHQKWLSERNKTEKEYQEALALHDRTQLSVLRAQLDQVDAELQMVTDRIARTQLRSPFDGVVVSGDLSQSLGAPVETGQVLYEVAPLDRYRVVLEVDEHDVAGIDGEKAGHLIIAALPDRPFAFLVDRLIPVAVAHENRNFFRVEASLSEPSPLLRPGMQGIARIEMGERSLLWIWTHAAIDRLRLWIWSVGL